MSFEKKEELMKVGNDNKVIIAVYEVSINEQYGLENEWHLLMNEYDILILYM
jgi:hypothetical protein